MGAEKFLSDITFCVTFVVMKTPKHVFAFQFEQVKCKCKGLQSAITVEQSQATLQLHPWQAFSSLSLSQLSWKYTSHYRVLPAGAKPSRIAITKYPFIHLGREEQRVKVDLLSSSMPWWGLEPTIFWFKDEHLNHWTTGTSIKISHILLYIYK